MRNHRHYEVKKGWMMPHHQRSAANSSGSTSQLSNIDSDEDENMDEEKDENMDEEKDDDDNGENESNESGTEND